MLGVAGVMSTRAIFFGAVVVVGLCGLLGCGRQSTRMDCELVVDRNVEVKLRSEGTTDETVIQKKKDEMRVAEKARIDECVGKRITDGMISCVKSAKTADEIDKCLR